MSSAMQNFMGAYAAVHNSEAKEEYYSVRDVVSEMNVGVLTDNDLREIAEEVCETLFSQEMKLEEVENNLTEVLEEGQNVGRNRKTSRLLAAFVETFDRIKSKANRLESFAKYRESKKLQETWSSRFNQDKRVQRHHSALVANECANVKSGLLELYKGKHGQTEKQYQDSRSDAGKMVSGDSKMSGAKYTSGRRVSDGGAGPQPAGGSMKPKAQGRMDSGSRADLQYRKANMKKKSMKESWADAYKSVYEAAKPDYLDFDKDGNEKESMKKALKDKKKHGMKGHKCDDDCDEKMEEGYKELPKNKMFRKAGNLGREVVSPSTTDEKRQKSYDRSKKIIKTLNKANEEVSFSETELKKFEEIVNSWTD